MNQNQIKRFIFALSVVGALIMSFVWSCRIQREVRELDEPHKVAPKGASSPGFVGSQGLASGQVSGFNWRFEAMPKMTLVAANGALTFGTIPVPLGPAGLGEYWGDVIYTVDGVDASTNCDGGVCSGLLEMKIPVDIHGGQCCIMGGSKCSTDGGGGLSSYILNDTASTGVSSGAAAQIVCDPVGQTLSLQFLAGPNSSFWVGGIISHGQFAATTSVDASIADTGPVDAADAADSADSGPAPTISPIAPLVAYLITANGGGLPITLAGTNLSGCVGGAICGLDASVSCTSTSVTYTNPPAIAPDAAGCTATVTTGGGTAYSDAGVIISVPTDLGPCWYAPEGFDAGGGTSPSWTDFVTLNPATQAGAGSPVYYRTGWGPNGQPAIESDASTTALVTLDAGATAQGPYQWFAVAQVNNLSITPGMAGGPAPTNYTAALQFAPNGSFGNTDITGYVVHTGANAYDAGGIHEFESQWEQADSGLILDNVTIARGAGTTGSDTPSGAILFSYYFSGAYTEGMVGDMGLFCKRHTAVSLATENMFNAIQCKIYGTPCNTR
jgi:hypothetical protein